MARPTHHAPCADPKRGPAIRLIVCVGPRCGAEGEGRALLAALEEALAAAFPAPEDVARISCASRDCLRFCTSGPVVRIEPSGEVFANPAIGDLSSLVREALSNAKAENADASSS